MAARVTADEVKQIMDNCTATHSVINAFINAANLIVTSEISDESGVDDDELKEIERWLTAHMIASTIHRTAAREGVGDASITYTGQWGKELDLTPYGQMVKVLDTSGILASLGKRKVRIHVIQSFDD